MVWVHSPEWVKQAMLQELINSQTMILTVGLLHLLQATLVTPMALVSVVRDSSLIHAPMALGLVDLAVILVPPAKRSMEFTAGSPAHVVSGKLAHSYDLEKL